MFVYTYSIIQVVYYRQYFGSDYPATMCSSIHSCFLYSIDLGLRNGGGIADSMDILDLSNPHFGAKLIFDLSYYMLINIVSMNIIFGIIIDTFAQLRDDQNTRDEDTRNVCFICGYERDVFEKQSKSFDKHVAHEHNPTNYINFLIHVQSKPDDLYDGIEAYVAEQLKKKKTQWAPIEKTEFITIDKDEIDLDTKVDTLQERMDEFKSENEEKTEEIDKKFEELMELLGGGEGGSRISVKSNN